MEKASQPGKGTAEGPVATPQVQVNTEMVKEQHPFWSKNIKSERKESAKGMLMGLALITGEPVSRSCPYLNTRRSVKGG